LGEVVFIFRRGSKIYEKGVENYLVKKEWRTILLDLQNVETTPLFILSSNSNEWWRLNLHQGLRLNL